MLAKGFRHAIKTRRQSFALWINKKPPLLLTEFDPLFDYVIYGDCDEVALLISV
jgi:hypothetical protein